MKKQSDHFPHISQFTKDNPDTPIWVVPMREPDRRSYLELMRFVFNENIKILRVQSGIGCLSIEDRDKIVAWRKDNMLHSMNVGIFPGFNKMMADVRDNDLRIATFDIFYGFKEDILNDGGGMRDCTVNFYSEVMNAMTARFYGVKQSFDGNSLGEEPPVWMFYFENENDHLVFSSLVDLEIQSKSGLFKPPPEPTRVMNIDVGTTGNFLMANTTISGLASINFAPSKMKLTGRVTNNPDGTITIEEV